MLGLNGHLHLTIPSGIEHLTPPPSHPVVVGRELAVLLSVDDVRRALQHLEPALETADAPRVQVSTDLLFEAHSRLFPAERMLVAGGRRSGSEIVLTSLWDVTGEANSVHVAAEPRKLGDAVMAFQRTGCFLAGWFHSHPGEGPSSVGPSNIDLRNLTELRDVYSSNLAAVILSRDGYVRTFDSDERHVAVDFRGRGLSALEGYEDVYRLNA